MDNIVLERKIKNKVADYINNTDEHKNQNIIGNFTGAAFHKVISTNIDLYGMYGYYYFTCRKNEKNNKTTVTIYKEIETLEI